MVSLTFVKLAGYILAAIVLAVALSLFTPVIWGNANTALAMADDFLGTDFSGPPKILIPNAEVLKDGNVKLSWIVDHPKKVGVTKVFGGYKQSYKKGEVEIKYADEKFLIATLGPQEKKEHEWTSKKLQGPGWYKFSVNLFDKENNLVDRKEVYVGFFDSRDHINMEILYDLIDEYKREQLKGDLGAFIATQSLSRTLPNLPDDKERREILVKGLTREQVNELFYKWLDPYFEWKIKEDAAMMRARLLVEMRGSFGSDFNNLKNTFKAEGIVDIAELK